MPSRFDRFPGKRPEQAESQVFELPPRTLRKRYPFISHDPSFPEEKLPTSDGARRLLDTAREELEQGGGEPDISLRLILHFGLRDATKRAALEKILLATPPVDAAMHAVLKRALPADHPLEDNYPPDYGPMWHAVAELQPLHGLKIVDYGAADGSFVRILRALGAQAYGVDREDVDATVADKHSQRSYDLLNERNEPVIVIGQERFRQPDTQDFLAGADLFVSNRLLRVVNHTPAHRQVMDMVTERVLKAGGLVLTVPAFYDEHLDDDDHYGKRYSQFDYRGGDDGWDYSIARKLK